MFGSNKIFVDELSVGKRLDVFICENITRYSRSFIQKLFLNKNVLVNKKCVSKHYKVKFGDVICVNVEEPEPFNILKQNIGLDIVYEDNYLLVVNKKRGMVVHPAPGNYSGTLVNALMWHYEGELAPIGGTIRPGIVHRIDKNTTGLLVVAKTDSAFKSLSSQIKDHSLKREYVAIAHGILKQKVGVINLPIGRSFRNRKKMAVNFSNGKQAITHYEVLNEYNNFTYLKLNLKTGRTHQIRVHMAYLGHPIAGDDLYGRRLDASRFGLECGQCLHSREITFYHNKFEKNICVSAMPDEYFLNFLNRCQEGL